MPKARKDKKVVQLASRTKPFDVIVRGGRVMDPGRGVDGVNDLGIRDGKIAELAPTIAGRAKREINARGNLVIPGMIDTHGHIYQYVTGTFGMNPDQVGVRSGVTSVVDQGGAASLTIHGFRKFIVEPARTRVYCFISNYLVGGLAGHKHVGLYGPHGIDVRETIRAIEENRDIVKGIKCHAEVGGYSRWGIETLRLAKQASREAKVPVYIHLGRLWGEADGTSIDPESVIKDVIPLLDPGDILAHPFTKHAGAFVSREGKLHPLISEAMKRGVRIDIGRGGHMSFDAAKVALGEGVMPYTVGADIHGYTVRKKNQQGAWNGGSFAQGDSEFSKTGTTKAAKRKVDESIGGVAVFSLVQVMNELMALGVALPAVIKMVTQNAATVLDLQNELGTLAVGSAADISVLGLDKGRWTLEDSLGTQIVARERLRPVMAIRAGTVVEADSPLLFESAGEAVA
jgi:dihydroorotase